ncbi:hypothetical protein C5167_011997, partial [Papaver somniferum]
PPSLGSCGDYNMYRLRRNQCGKEKWNVFYVMTCRPRSDIFINLPALCKMDNMLLVRQEPFVEIFYYLRQEILDSFRDTKF